MKINYQLTNSDFLDYQLYSSSKSQLHKRRRFRSRISIPLIYVILGALIANQNEDKGMSLLFFAGFGLVWFIFYPKYSKWRYKRHFQKHIEEHYKNRINKTVSLDLDTNELNTIDYTTQSKINATELKELIETKNHFFIKLTSDQSIIVPKHAISLQVEFKKRLTELGAEYVDELHWEWK